MDIGNNIKTIPRVVNDMVAGGVYDEIISKVNEIAMEYHGSTDIHQKLRSINSLYDEKRWT
jgi:hypothetical protein